MDQPRYSNKSPARNSNNNSNRVLPHHPGSSKDTEFDELGEIHPQTTPEGYGLRTPYGTHFNLDFLKYCQNFAGQDATSQSSSERSSLVSSDSRSESTTNDLHDSKSSTESTLWETRRRLDMFRSYRKQKSSHTDSKQHSRYKENRLRLSENSSVNDLTINEFDFPSPSAKSPPAQQQNLQAVREQMATALSRLKYLENEAKQIPILKVQISVLQQEKVQMTEQLKSFQDKATNRDTAKKIISSPPPPPPRRKYKSVGVCTDKPKRNFGFSSIHLEDYIPKREEPLDSSPKFLKEHFQRFQIRSNAATQTELEELKLKSATLTDNHCQTDKLLCNDKSMYFSPQSFDFSANVHILGSHAITQTSPNAIDSATSTSDLLIPPIDRSTNTECLTVDKSVHFKPLTSDFTCYAKVNSGVDVGTSTDIPAIFADDIVVSRDVSAQDISASIDFNVDGSPVMKDAVVLCDAPIQHNPTSSDFGVNVSMMTETMSSCHMAVQNTPTSSDFGVNVSFMTENSMVLCDASVQNTPALLDFGVSVSLGTEDTVLCDASVQNTPASSDIGVIALPSMEDASVSAALRLCSKDVASQINSEMKNVGILAKSEFADFSCNTVGTETKDFAVCVIPARADFTAQFSDFQYCTHDISTNTDTTQKKDFETQFHPSVVDSAVDPVFANIPTHDFSAQFDPIDNTADPIAVKTKEIAVQVESKTVDAQIDCTTKMTDVSAQTETVSVYATVFSASTQTEAVSDVSDGNVPSCLSCDIATDTSDLQSTILNENEIGTYVGQVESLLDEQQLLLARQYQQLGVEVENSHATEEPHVNEARQPESSQKKILLNDKRYMLPQKARDACQLIVIGLRSEDNEAVPWDDALEVLKEEWFSVSLSTDAKPESIQDFAEEVRSVSPKVLSKVVNSLDSTGNCPIHYAVCHRRFSVIAALVDIPEFNVNQYNKAGYTASMLAAITQLDTDYDVKAVDKLFQKADVCLHARQAGQTALMLAVSHGCVLSAKLLLSAGADVNAQDEDGSTALMCATEHGHIELVKILLAEPDCDPTIADNDGSTAINIAMDTGQRDIGVLLYVHLNLDESESK